MTMAKADFIANFLLRKIMRLQSLNSDEILLLGLIGIYIILYRTED